MSDYENWHRKYRQILGCKADPCEVCLCTVCCALERAWEEAMRTAIEQVSRVRLPGFGAVAFETLSHSSPSGRI